MKMPLTAFLLLSVTIAIGQKSQVPSKVKTSFNEKFVNVEKLEWVKSKEGKTYLAHFYQDNVEKTANFSAKGAWLYTSTYVLDTELPEQVIDEINYNYLNDLILFSEYRVTNKGEKFYMIKLKPFIIDEDGNDRPQKLTAQYLLIFAPDGNLIAREDNLK